MTYAMDTIGPKASGGPGHWSHGRLSVPQQPSPFPRRHATLELRLSPSGFTEMPFTPLHGPVASGFSASPSGSSLHTSFSFPLVTAVHESVPAIQDFLSRSYGTIQRRRDPQPQSSASVQTPTRKNRTQSPACATPTRNPRTLSPASVPTPTSDARTPSPVSVQTPTRNPRIQSPATVTKPTRLMLFQGLRPCHINKTNNAVLHHPLQNLIVALHPHRFFENLTHWHRSPAPQYRACARSAGLPPDHLKKSVFDDFSSSKSVETLQQTLSSSGDCEAETNVSTPTSDRVTRPLLGPSHPTHSSNHNSRNVPRPSRASHTTWSKYPTLRCYHQRLEHRPNLHNRCTILRSLQKNKSTRALGRVHDGRYWPDTCCTNASHSKASHGSLINRGENAHMPAAAAPVAKVIWDGLRHELPTPTGQNKGRSTRREEKDRWTRGTTSTGRGMVRGFVCRGVREDQWPLERSVGTIRQQRGSFATTQACSFLQLERTTKSLLSNKISLNSQPLRTHEPASCETPITGVRTQLRSDWYDHETARCTGKKRRSPCSVNDLRGPLPKWHTQASQADWALNWVQQTLRTRQPIHDGCGGHRADMKKKQIQTIEV